MDCYSLHTAVSCENILFWTQKSGFCPLSPETRRWPTDSCWQKGTDSFCTGDPSASEKAQWEGSPLGTQLHDGHHAGSEQLQMDRPQDGSPDSPITAGSEASVWGRVETQRERQSPSSKAGCKAFENASRKQNSCFSLFEGLQGDDTADGYFCSQKTSRIRVGPVFRQMCSLKALLSLHNSEACSRSICSLNIPKA